MKTRVSRFSAAFTLLVAALIILVPTAAHASALFAYNQTLGDNTNNPTSPSVGWENGSGAVDGGFSTITSVYNTDPSEEYYGFVRFSINGVGPITPSVENQYNQPSGAIINVDFGELLTGLTLSDFNTTVTIDDTTTGESYSFNPLVTTPDNTYFNASGTKIVGPVSDPGSESGFEQSERLTFAFIQSVIGYNIGDGILLTETAIPLDLSTADPTVNATLNATPEPGSMFLIGGGLLAAGLMGRKKFTARGQQH